MNNRLVMALVGVIIVLVAALAFVLGRQSTAEPTVVSPVPQKPVMSAVHTPAQPVVVSKPEAAPLAKEPSTPAALNAGDLVPLKGAKPFTEKLEFATLTFLPTEKFRKLIAYREPAISPSEDATCTKVYTKREKVRKIEYAWDFVIRSFTTWNDDEGQQEYMVSEETLPKAFQGSLHDIVREGRTVTIEKQLCGMGQVEGLVSIRP